MFTRVDRGQTPPQKADAFASFMRDDVLPRARELPGYVSAWIGIDRRSGRVTVMTTWASREARGACDSAFAAVLANADLFGLVPIEIELYDDVDLGPSP